MTKYKAIATVVNGIRFDSKKEAAEYVKFQMLYKAGEITEIILQPEFILQPAFTKNGKKYRPIIYRADFKVTWKNGKVHIYDVKGHDKRGWRTTKDFDLKKKMFEYHYRDFTITFI